jgi:hypothetical protein
MYKKEGGNMSKKLSMSFTTSLGGTASYTLDAPKDELTEEEVRTVMQIIITDNLFDTTNGDLSEVKAAEVVTTLTDTLI